MVTKYTTAQNSWFKPSSCFSLSGVGITGMHHCTWLQCDFPASSHCWLYFLSSSGLPLTVAITVPPSTVTPTAEMQISGSYVVLSTFSLWLLGGPEKSKNSHWKTHHLPASTWMSECKRKKKSPSLGIFILDYFTVTFTSCPEQQIQWVHDRKKN